MKSYMLVSGKNALLALLFLTVWATTPLPTLAQETKTIIVKKATSDGPTVVSAEAADKDSPDQKVIIKSIELPDGEGVLRKDLPWLGVSLNEAGEALTSQLGLDPGVGLVATYVAPDSPAAKAGLQKNDVLVEFQDQSLVLPAQLRKLVQARKEGDVVKLKFYRAGKPQTVSATLTKTAPGVRVADGDGGLLRELHLRLLGQPSGKELELQMESLKGLLGNLKIDAKQIQEEVRRSVDKARKSYQDALRQMDKSTSTSDASRQALEELARSGVLLDNKATVTVRSTDKSSRSLVKTDDSGTIVIVANPKLHLTAHDRDGKLLFDGAIETEEERAKVPKEVWEKVEPMLAKMNSKPEE
jgi:hypothetical protein